MVKVTSPSKIFWDFGEKTKQTNCQELLHNIFDNNLGSKSTLKGSRQFLRLALKKCIHKLAFCISFIGSFMANIIYIDPDSCCFYLLRPMKDILDCLAEIMSFLTQKSTKHLDSVLPSLYLSHLHWEILRVVKLN